MKIKYFTVMQKNVQICYNLYNTTVISASFDKNNHFAWTGIFFFINVFLFLLHYLFTTVLMNNFP